MGAAAHHEMGICPVLRKLSILNQRVHCANFAMSEKSTATGGQRYVVPQLVKWLLGGALC